MRVGKIFTTVHLFNPNVIDPRQNENQNVHVTQVYDFTWRVPRK